MLVGPKPNFVCVTVATTKLVPEEGGQEEETPRHALSRQAQTRAQKASKQTKQRPSRSIFGLVLYSCFCFSLSDVVVVVVSGDCWLLL